ncbi:ABC transporter permease [Leptotrichia sp. HSP-342]|uniref:Transport permease protein n=1 Tax=Leptotrichia mesophila TaxID=3239303 RepID=A0AB39VBG8_9FUSO
MNNFIKYKDLLFELVLRDIKIKYKKSMLGFTWSILNPLLMMTVMSVVFSTMFRMDIPNFPMYLIIGQVVFSFFSEATNIAMVSVIENGELMKKVYIPKYMFPLSKVIFSFSNMIFSLVAILIVALITRLPLRFEMLLFPIPLIYVFVFSLGIGFILASYTVFFRDLLHLYSILLLVWTYLTPIFYPIKILPESVRSWINYNPIYMYIKYFRSIMLYGKIPSLQFNLICIITSLISLIIGIWIFSKKEDKFIFYV